MNGNYGTRFFFDYPQASGVTPLARVIMTAPGVNGSFITPESYNVGGIGYNYVSNAIDSARAAGIKWIIVGMHKNCLSTGTKNCAVGADFTNLLINKKVDLVLQGHDHTYQRTHSLNCLTQDSFNSACIADNGADGQYTKGVGTIFSITGTFGQGLYDINTADPEAGYFASSSGANKNPTFGVSKFTVSDSAITAQFVKSSGSGTLADSYTISAPSSVFQVNSVSPTSGPTAGGTNVTISGSLFEAGDTVTIGGVAATNVAFVNSSTLTASTPSHAAGTVDVVVKHANGQTATKTGGFTYNAPAPTDDLIVTDVTWTPANPAAGQAVTFSATIKNQGTGPTPSGIKHGIAFKVDGVTVNWSDNNTTSLAAGASRTQTANSGINGVATYTVAATPNPHSVEAFVDDTSIIPESNETNNKLAKSMPVASSGCTPPAETPGVGSSSIQVDVSAGTYRVWTRMKAADATNNSYYLSTGIDCGIVIGDRSSTSTNGVSSTNWTWVGYRDGVDTTPAQVSFTSGGLKTITLTGKEPSVKIDRVLLLSDSCVPTGTGENCIDTTAPTVSVTAPASGSYVRGDITLLATVSDAGGSGVSKVDFLVDGAPAGTSTSTSSPYQLTWRSNSVPDGTHTVQAIATDGAGNPGQSSSVSFTVQNADTAAPTAPTNLQLVSNAYNKVDLSWTASTDNVGVTRYEVFRNGNSVGSTTTTTFSDTSVAANTSYTYTVKAWDAAGNPSTSSSGLPVTTPPSPDTASPTAPTNLQLVGNAYNKVDLSWTASSDNVGVTRYDVLRGGVAIGNTTSTTYSDTSVLPNNTYTYSVVARDAANNASPASSFISVTTPNAPDTMAPTAPTNLTATASSTQISLTWTASTDNIGVAYYKVFRDGVQLAVVNGTSFDDATATPGQTYTYYVKAYDSVPNPSLPSNTVSATIPNVVSPPVVLNFAPSHDATISKSSSTRNYGTSTELRADNSPVYQYLLKFNVTGIGTRTVTGANLQLYVANYSAKGGNFYGTTSTSWGESTVTWANAPTVSTSLLTSLGIVNEGQYAQVNLSNYITHDGVYSLRVSTTNKDAAIFASKESATRPQLTVTAQ
jgi:chitodextrinase